MMSSSSPRYDFFLVSQVCQAGHSQPNQLRHEGLLQPPASILKDGFLGGGELAQGAQPEAQTGPLLPVGGCECLDLVDITCKLFIFCMYASTISLIVFLTFCYVALKVLKTFLLYRRVYTFSILMHRYIFYGLMFYFHELLHHNPQCLLMCMGGVILPKLNMNLL